MGNEIFAVWESECRESLRLRRSHRGNFEVTSCGKQCSMPILLQRRTALALSSLRGLRTSREHQSRGDISREAAASRRSAHEDVVSVAESLRAPRASPTQSARELQSPMRNERQPQESTREEG